MQNKNVDVAIIGAGPAGLTAAIYALRSGLKVSIIEKLMIGGQASLTYDIKNYPGFETISGMELGLKMHAQAESLGAETVYGEVEKIEFKKGKNKLFTTDGELVAKTIILAMGAKARNVGAVNEEKFIGRGVAYCAVCDGSFYKNKDVVLVGGGNSAVEDAIYLSKIAKSVTIINNLNLFTAQEVLVQEINEIIKNGNIKVFHKHVVTKVLGENSVCGVEVKSLETGKVFEIPANGMFVAIGRIPDCDIVKGNVNVDNNGYIIANEHMETNVEGVFVCGDVRVKSLRQIITACADGAIAATSANNYINNFKL